MIAQLPFQASQGVRTALEQIGRTEDVRFSPDNRLLAIAGFTTNSCLVLRVDINQTGAGPEVIAHDHLFLSADTMNYLHGVDFVDNKTLALANREGIVSIVKLPDGELAGRHCHVTPVQNLRGGLFCKIRSPGSIAARPIARGRVELLVCNNYRHRVSRHVVDPAAGYRVRRNKKLLEEGLNIPDGITFSHDGRWIAVSSHGTHDIKIYDAARRLGRKTKPVGVLRDANYPHGLRFTEDDGHLLVADAGGPVMFVFARGESWAGERRPVHTVQVMDDETFESGHINEMDGGPKGLDIDKTNRVVALTCDQQPLTFFSLADIVAGREAVASRGLQTA